MPVDPQRLVDPWDEEDQADPGALHDVGDRVEQVVAREVGDGNALIVEHDDETGRPALWRHVAAAIGRRCADQNERRRLDERACVLIELVENLHAGSLGRHAVDLAQLVDAADYVLEWITHSPNVSLCPPCVWLDGMLVSEWS